jgi:UDP-N-acetylmuramoyl-L-alanyl-D-glutamate--2,6-diaminopimelate ligase
MADRREAIKVACSMAEPKDIILVAGKGHETYQEIKGERFPFDDREVLKEMLNLIHK